MPCPGLPLCFGAPAQELRRHARATPSGCLGCCRGDVDSWRAYHCDPRVSSTQLPIAIGHCFEGAAYSRAISSLHASWRPYEATTASAFLADLGAGLTDGAVALPLATAFAIASAVKARARHLHGDHCGLLISLLQRAYGALLTRRPPYPERTSIETARLYACGASSRPSRQAPCTRGPARPALGCRFAARQP